MQRLSFLTITFGQIKSAFVKKMQESAPYIKHMSIKECLAKASRLKLSQHKDKKWHVAVTVKKTADMMEGLGVDTAEDIKKLNNHTY